MRALLPVLALGMFATTAGAGEIRSEYTDIDAGRTCSVFDIANEGGEFANLACAGYRGYPVMLYSGDLRESVFFGFQPDTGHVWESFGPFNGVGAKVEWRIESDGDREIPFATILRWSVSNPEDADRTVEVLVVEKVGLVDERQGCAVGLVMATGNPKANETARRIADEQAREFVCGADERVVVQGKVPMPDFSAQD